MLAHLIPRIDFMVTHPRPFLAMFSATERRSAIFQAKVIISSGTKFLVPITCDFRTIPKVVAFLQTPMLVPEEMDATLVPW